MALENMLNLTANATRPTRASDGQGGWTITQQPLWQGVAVAVGKPTEREMQLAAAFEAAATDVVYTAYPRDVDRDDVITISNGLAGRVIVAMDEAGRQHHLRILVDRSPGSGQ